MSVSGIGGGVSHLQGMDAVRAGGALGDHTVEQITNTRVEPRETSLGSAIKSFFKGIGDIFSKLKAEFKESRAAEKERTAEKKMAKAAGGFADALANDQASAKKFFKMTTVVAKHAAPEDVARIAAEKTMDAIRSLPDDKAGNALTHLRQFGAPGGTGEALKNVYDQALANRVDVLIASDLGGASDRVRAENDDLRGQFADKVAAFDAALSSMLENTVDG